MGPLSWRFQAVISRRSSGQAFLERAAPERKKSPQSPARGCCGGGGGVAWMLRSLQPNRAPEDDLIYRRSFEEMPAIRSEVSLAKEQGVMFWIQSDPKRILKDPQKRVKGIECLEVKLGSPDKSGRKRPIPVKGTEFQLDVDLVIGAIGQR
jgi:glutamate synthase (NADPH/NADH) small chain